SHRDHLLCLRTSCWTISLRCQPFFCPVSEPSDPEGGIEDTFGMLGHGMTRSNLFEYLIIQERGVLLTDGTEIPTHDPSKTREFGDMKPLPMRVQLFQITGMVKNARYLPNLPLLKTQVRVVDLGKEILGMTTIGFPNTGVGFLQVPAVQIGNTEIVRQRGNMRV